MLEIAPITVSHEPLEVSGDVHISLLEIRLNHLFLNMRVSLSEEISQTEVQLHGLTLLVVKKSNVGRVIMSLSRIPLKQSK